MANNKDVELTFDDLINAMDEDPSIMREYQDFMQKELAKQKQFNSEVDNKKKF